MALVDKEQEIFWEVVQQGHGRRTHRTPGDDPGIVFDAVAVAQLLHHLDVIQDPLFEPLGLHQLVVLLEPGHPLFHLTVNFLNSGVHLLLGGDIVAGRPDGNVVEPPDGGAGDHVDLGNAVDLVAEKFHPDGGILPVGRENFHRVPTDAEHITLKGDVVALVAVLHQPAEQFVPFHGVAHPEGDHHFLKILRFAQTVDAGHRRHHDHIPPFQQGAGGREPQPVDLLVGGGVLFDIGIGVGNIGLRLVIVVVGDEILHGVIGEKLLELGAQLGRQGLIVGQHQGGTLDGLDGLGHGKGLAGAGDAQQRLLRKPHLHAPGEGGDGRGLIAGGLILTDHMEFGHNKPPSCTGRPEHRYPEK